MEMKIHYASSDAYLQQHSMFFPEAIMQYAMLLSLPVVKIRRNMETGAPNYIVKKIKKLRYKQIMQKNCHKQNKIESYGSKSLLDSD